MTDATRLTRAATQTGIADDNDHLACVFKVDIDSTEVTASRKCPRVALIHTLHLEQARRQR